MAGDALLTLAFEVMLEQKNVPAEALVETVREVAMCAGNFGMVGGQVIDLDSEGRQISEEELRKLHAGKTGALFIAAVRSGARLSGAASDELLALTKFADLLGLAFQITDDILDVEGDAAQMGKAAHSDEKKHKSTYVTLYTLEGAKALAQKTVDEALGCLEMFGENAEALREITKASSTTGTTALSTAAAKTAGQRSPEPLYRHSDGKTAKQRRYSCSGTTYPDYPRNRTMPGKSENAAAAGRSFKNRSGSNCRGRCTQKNFPRYYHSH